MHGKGKCSSQRMDEQPDTIFRSLQRNCIPGKAGGIAGGLNGNNPTIKGCIAWNEQIDGEPVSGRVIGWQSNTYTKATDCYAKKDMIIA